MTLAVAVYLYPDVEVLDFAGPYEVFTTASRVHQRHNPGAADLFRVFTIARREQLLAARAGLTVKPDYTIDDHPPIDVLIVPGGVHVPELAHADVTAWIGAVHARASITASVCTGAFLLAQAGLLDGKTATTHWEDIPDLQTAFPAVRVVGERRWVDQGAVVTAAGISAGIDMSLHLVARLAGRPLAIATARQMEVDWQQG